MRALFVLAACAAALVACGKSTEDRYREDFPPIDRDLAAVGRDVAAGLHGAGGHPNEALAREFGVYAQRLGELRDRLDELDPPGPVKADQARLESAATATERALLDVAAAARAGDSEAAAAAATRLVRSGELLDSARRNVAKSALFD